jgi:hypothetical protein
MDSLLETLPNELLDVLIGNLNNAGVASLLQCSKHLHRCLEPSFYGIKNVRDKAMHSACKRGNQETIRLALSYGADVSVVHWEPGGHIYQQLGKAAGGLKMRTLQLAARKGNLETFSLLLNLGAKIDMARSKELNDLVCRLSTSGNETLLRTFLQSELSRQISRRCRINLPLIPMILRKAPFEFVKMLLDEGADPNQFLRHKEARTPLSAAIITNSTQLFDLLIRHGARLKVEHQLGYKHRGPSPVPVFTAAFAMAKQGDTTFMQRCLDAGADINCEIDFNWSFPAKAYRLGWTPCRISTPVLYYLNAITSWVPSSTSLRPVEGVKYLLDRGAELNINTFSAAEITLLQWNLKQLADPGFFTLMQVLIENGSGKSRTVHMLIQATRMNCWDPEDRSSPTILANWKAFVQLLLKHRDKEQDTVNSLLNRLLYDHRKDDPPYSALGDLDRCTVECLIEAGATLRGDMLSSKRDWYRSMNRLLRMGEDPFGCPCPHGHKYMDTRPCALG